MRTLLDGCAAIARFSIAERVMYGEHLTERMETRRYWIRFFGLKLTRGENCRQEGGIFVNMLVIIVTNKTRL